MAPSDSCYGCGICCDLYGTTLEVVTEDLARWEREGRDDLLRQVGPGGRLWRDLTTEGEMAESCPYIVRTGPDTAHCGIHETKPAICKAYPTDLHGRRCMCGVSFAP